jgi:hypothetical protein
MNEIFNYIKQLKFYEFIIGLILLTGNVGDIITGVLIYWICKEEGG